MTATVTETTFLVRREDGSAPRRGLKLHDAFPEATATSVLFQLFSGVTEVRVLGTIEGNPATTRVRDVDYAPDGTREQSAIRLLGADARLDVLCDCGKGRHCPQFGEAAAAASGSELRLMDGNR